MSSGQQLFGLVVGRDAVHDLGQPDGTHRFPGLQQCARPAKDGVLSGEFEQIGLGGAWSVGVEFGS